MARYYERIDKKVKSLCRQIDRIYRTAIEWGITHTQINERIQTQVYGDERYAKLPRWAHSEIHGYMEAWRKRIWYEEIVWCRQMAERVDGEPENMDGWAMSKAPGDHARMSPPIRYNAYQMILQQAHCWRRHFENGQVKFFTEPSDPYADSIPAVQERARLLRGETS